MMSVERIVLAAAGMMTSVVVALVLALGGGCEGIEKRPGLLDVVLTPGPVEMEVMTFNIRYGTAADGENAWEKRREMVFATIRDRRPDVVCLQEALRGQLDELREALDEYAEAGVGRDDGREKGEYAAILVRKDRWRLEAQKTFWLSETPEVAGSKGWGARLPRVCTFVTLAERRSNRQVQVYNVHFDHESARARAKSAELLSLAVERTRLPGVAAVVAGDLNEGENGPVVRYLTGRAERASDGGAAPASPKLLDTFRAVHATAEGVGTYHGFKGERGGAKIDFVLVDRNVRVIDAGIDTRTWDGRYASDHFAVWAKVALPGPFGGGGAGGGGSAGGGA